MEFIDHRSAGRDAQFRENAAQVGAYGPCGDAELMRGLFVRQAGSDQPSYFQFAGAEGRFFPHNRSIGVKDQFVAAVRLIPGGDCLRLHIRR